MVWIEQLAISRRTRMITDIPHQLGNMIFKRELGEGARINEVRLAAGLGVSRIPLRETLAAPVVKGALYYLPQRGVSVRGLTP